MSIFEISETDDFLNVNQGSFAKGMEFNVKNTNETTLKSSMESMLTSTTEIVEDDCELDETFGERLLGLTEMVPESIRNLLLKSTYHGSSAGQCVFSFSRSLLWIFFSSAALLIAPVAIEAERLSMIAANQKQRNQILLGPNAVTGKNSLMMPSMLSPVPASDSLPSPPQA